MDRNASRKKNGKRWFQLLGPGLITGASDDDPSGIATYAQTGAQFGNGLLWTMLFSFPLMSAIQEISAHIGRVTGHGVAGNLRRYYPRWLLYFIVSLLLVANTINLGADLGAMAACLELLVGGPLLVYVFLFAAACLYFQIVVPYKKYVFYLEWLTLALLAYVATVFFIHVSWTQALHDTFRPSLTLDREKLTVFIAILGTTISPYLFFWQASEEVEELEKDGEKPVKRAAAQADGQFRRIKIDTYMGMFTSNLIAFFIILTAAATLHVSGHTQIGTAAEAAKTLEPLAGRFAALLFSLGIIGTGLLAVPVLAGSAAYGLGEALRWPVGLERKPYEAKGFYGILAASVVVGLALNFFGVNPIAALFWTAVLNGIVSVPLMITMMLMTTNPRVMGKNFTLSMPLRCMGWLATLVMGAAAAGLFLTLK